MRYLLLLSIILFPVISKAQVIQSSKPAEQNIFEKVEIEAEFKGGISKWIEFVKTNFNFDRIEKSLPDSITLFSDTARIQFIVDRNGIIKDIKFLTRIDHSFQLSCIEVYKNSSHWNPATQCGRSVNAYKKETFIVLIDKLNCKRVILIRS